jgi:hypothetical protein
MAEATQPGGCAPQPEILGPPEDAGPCTTCEREDAVHSVRIFPLYEYDMEDIVDLDLCETCLAYYRKYASLPGDEAERFADEHIKRLDRIMETEFYEDD